MSDSIHRVGLAVATLALIVTVGGYFIADGYLSAQAAVASSLPPKVVYVRAAPAPQVMQVTQTAPPAPPPHVVHITVAGTGGANDGGGDGENDGGGG
jgi:hypothetical protein